MESELVDSEERADSAEAPPRHRVLSDCIVVFQPSGSVARVPRGSKLLDAAQEAGVELDFPCGGQGRCGRCKVRIQAGEVVRPVNPRLTQEEIAQGFALACQTRIESNLVVDVPPREALTRIMVSAASAERRGLPQECDWQREPPIRRVFLTLQPPSLDDNTSDLDRLVVALGRLGFEKVIAELPVMRGLGPALRESEWQVTVVLEHAQAALSLSTVDTANQTGPDGNLWSIIDVLPGDRTGRAFGAAVDIGTTSVVVYLTDLITGQVVDSASAYNAQLRCGDDVIARIVYAQKPEGLTQLSQLVTRTINELLADLTRHNKVDPREIQDMVCAGNPTMTHLFLGLNPRSIRLEPYVPTVSRVPLVKARELGLDINPNASVHCLPSVGSWVGGDITAGIITGALHREERLTLFIDMGTNGEVVVGNREWMMTAACSAGPAFEGGGVRHGMRATMGAIDEVWINQSNLDVNYHVMGDGLPRGICGSGLMSLLADMFLAGIIDKSGHIRREGDTPRVRRGEHGMEYVIAWEGQSDRGRDIVITEADINNLLRAKAAIYAGVTVLLESVGVSVDDLEQVLIGGAFGQYLDIEKAIIIGLLPDLPWERFKYLGNSSAWGAYASLVCQDVRRQSMEVVHNLTYIELSATPSFMSEYTSALFIPHTDIGKFPSVLRTLKGE